MDVVESPIMKSLPSTTRYCVACILAFHNMCSSTCASVGSPWKTRWPSPNCSTIWLIVANTRSWRTTSEPRGSADPARDEESIAGVTFPHDDELRTRAQRYNVRSVPER
uniref:(northern house mosquito) hypothetical protein n=1 Tax=Culex pipiens TaxID=7175 RepID=A0A8D8G7F8_CULPI